MDHKHCCRVCQYELKDEFLFVLKNAPAQAQNFPDALSVKQDRGVDIQVVQCFACGLVQLLNRPVPYHREVIRAIAFSGEMKLFREKQFADFLTRYQLKGKKLIEVGSGKGEFLSLMKNAGGIAFGVEGSASSVEYALSQNLSSKHLYLDSECETIPEGPFDGFFIMSYLEHMPEPLSVLRSLARNLKDGAVGIIEVPNFDMIIRENQFSEFTTDHLLYFTDKTLRTTLELGGFEVIESKSIWHDYILSATVRKRPALSLATMNSCSVKLIADIDRHILEYPQSRFAVWGAGHQSLTILSMLQKKNRIDCVIDSAPFKQNKFTPSSQLPIFSPDQINPRGITDIIAIAGSYNNEVIRFIEQSFPDIQVSYVESTRYIRKSS